MPVLNWRYSRLSGNASSTVLIDVPEMLFTSMYQPTALANVDFCKELYAGGKNSDPGPTHPYTRIVIFSSEIVSRLSTLLLLQHRTAILHMFSCCRETSGGSLRISIED